MIKKSIKLLFLILVVAILQIIFASSVNADALVASCQSTPANSLQNPIAINQSVNFISNVIGGTGNYIYSWFGACIGTQANCQNLYTSEGNYAAYLTVSDGSESQITACTAYVRQSCTSHDYKSCVGNAVYWFNSCNIQEEQFQACTGNQTCANGSCVDIACSSNSNCGNNGLIDSPFCQSGNVYQNYKTYTCHNPGTASSSCTNLITPQLQTNCTGNQTCSNGSCSAISCSNNSQCGTNGFTGNLFCQSGNVYQNYINYTCNNPGTASSSCSNYTTAQLQTTCTGNQTCSNGSCGNSCTQNYQQRCSGSNLYWYDSCNNQGNLIQYCTNGCSGNSCIVNNCTSNYQQRCSGNNLYWYDSCGNQQNLIQYCTNGCSGNSCTTINNNSALTVTETVRNLTSGSGFSTSTYASPSDMLMFMITLQSTGNQDIQNVFVRDTLPANLIYSNQLVVARTNNVNNNYSGDIITGLNLNTISTGQTVTITYQAQVASITNFAYGTTTLNDNVYITSSQSGYTPTNNASVIVTRGAVLGASTVSTGLTNNFWVDSFFLPLLITIIAIFMWKSGMFFGIEKWLDSKKKTRRNYKAEKELAKRIKQISGN